MQFTDYIMRQVNEGKGRLAPGFDPYRIIDNMFFNQDRNGDGTITEAEFKLKADESAAHDELWRGSHREKVKGSEKWGFMRKEEGVLGQREQAWDLFLFYISIQNWGFRIERIVLRGKGL